MSQLALDLIRQAKREGWKSLDLGKTGLTDDNMPDELFDLVELEKLRLCNQVLKIWASTCTIWAWCCGITILRGYG